MARYCAFLERKVEVRYRAGEIVLSASATLVADSGRSIFLEEHFAQGGQQKQFRWEIPYACIVEIVEKAGGFEPVAFRAGQENAPRVRAAAAAEAKAPLLPVPPRPKEA
ncbi:MAG: hypothetical protein LAN84_14910 [Acidobacteriia bacterium]|nr:hypothetical protein [Terriglobia bacterium]